MGKFLFQLIGTIITLAIIGLIGYLVFTRLFQYLGDPNRQEVNAVDRTTSINNIEASTSDLKIEHNAERDGMIGMYIYSKQNYRYLKGIACYTVLTFFDDNGNLLKGNRFKDDDGNFCFYTPPLTPETDNVTNEQRAFIPYEEFSLPEEGTVYFNCILTVYIENNKKQRTELATSAISRFHLSR